MGAIRAQLHCRVRGHAVGPRIYLPVRPRQGPPPQEAFPWLAKMGDACLEGGPVPSRVLSCLLVTGFPSWLKQKVCLQCRSLPNVGDLHSPGTEVPLRRKRQPAPVIFADPTDRGSWYYSPGHKELDND